MKICLSKIKQLTSFEYASNYFKIGVFLLLSAPGIAVIFLLFSSLISFIKKRHLFLKDKLNFYLIASSIFMILSCIHKSFQDNYPYENWSPSLSWYGLANWIPLFLFFWSFQPFLNSDLSRRKISLLFIYGTLPLLITGILQYFFGVYGPFETLNGLIIWFSRPLASDQGLTGLFNNPNYAGAWLSIVFPFSLATIVEKEKSKLKFISYLFFILILIVLILTFSRSAWLNASLSVLLILGKSGILFLFPIIILIGFIAFGCIFGFDGFITNEIISSKFCPNFQELGFNNSHRLIIWSNALDLIKSRAFLGYGASSFALLYLNKSGRVTTHSHNILIEIAINYGSIVALILGIFVSHLIFKGFKKLYLIKYSTNPINNFDRAWWISILVIALSHMYDNQYYDLRISISSWIILAGIRNIIKE